MCENAAHSAAAAPRFSHTFVFRLAHAHQDPFSAAAAWRHARKISSDVDQCVFRCDAGRSIDRGRPYRRCRRRRRRRLRPYRVEFVGRDSAAYGAFYSRVQPNVKVRPSPVRLHRLHVGHANGGRSRRFDPHINYKKRAETRGRRG